MSNGSAAVRFSALLGLALATATVPGAAAQQPDSPLALSPAGLKAAFVWGLTADERLLAQYELHSDVNWLVNFDTPWLRVAQWARARKIEGQDVAVDDVPESVSAPEVQFYAHARADPVADKQGLRLPDAEYMSILVARSDRPDQTILPLSIQTFIRRVPQEDAFTSRTRIARSARGTFPLTAFVAGNRLRILFSGGGIVTIPIPEKLVATVR